MELNVFHHSGDLGDIIYSMPTIRELGGGWLCISPENDIMRYRQAPTFETAIQINSLLRHVSYIAGVSYSDKKPGIVTHNLNEFRRGYKAHSNLAGLHAKAFNVPFDETKPWIKLAAGQSDFVVIARSERYHNPEFPWSRIVEAYHENLFFVGLIEEHQKFVDEFGPVSFLYTPTLGFLARAIWVSKLFIGNQSCPMAIAAALGKPFIQEVWTDDENCVFNRPNATYFRTAKDDIMPVIEHYAAPT